MIFDFKQKKETRKGINTSQLVIRNFNDITGKHMNKPCFFFCLYVIFFKGSQMQI